MNEVQANTLVATALHAAECLRKTKGRGFTSKGDMTMEFTLTYHPERSIDLKTAGVFQEGTLTPEPYRLQRAFPDHYTQCYDREIQRTWNPKDRERLREQRRQLRAICEAWEEVNHDARKPIEDSGQRDALIAVLIPYMKQFGITAQVQAGRLVQDLGTLQEYRSQLQPLYGTLWQDIEGALDACRTPVKTLFRTGYVAPSPDAIYTGPLSAETIADIAKVKS